MRTAYTSEAIRTAEAPLLADGVPLMRRAARAIAERAAAVVSERRAAGVNAEVLVLVGGGNNGGDGLWAAYELADFGLAPRVLLAHEHPHAEGLAAARGAGVKIDQLADVDDVAAYAGRFGIWLDALAGIGLSGPLREPLACLIDALAAERERAETFVLAVDCPSGLSDDPGASLAIRADETITFAALTPALLLPPACRLIGRVRVENLGIELVGAPAAIELGAAELRASFPRARHLDHKYTRGVVGIDAGSETYPGAGLLATRAALAAGPGMVRFLGEEGVARLIIPAMPEVVTAPGRIQAALIGSGTEGGPRIAAALADFLARDIPVVADAGALTCVSEAARDRGALILTPHLGELATLLGCEREDVEADPVRYARQAAERFDAVVVAKGPETVIVEAGQPVVTIPPASPYLATAGSGDVLAGVLAATLAQFAARAEAGETVPALSYQAGIAAQLHASAVAHCPSAPGPIRALDLAAGIALALGATMEP